jgi:hypothetical protein
MIGPATFNERHYVPLLRVEKAEIGSCEDAEANGADEYTPLFLITPKNYDNPPQPGVRQRTRRPATAVDIAQRINAKAASIIGWANRPRLQDMPRAFVDVVKMDNAYGGSHLEATFAHFAQHYRRAVPVTYLDRPVQYPHVAAIDGATGTGMALRLRALDQLNLANVDGVLLACGVTATRTDLIIDIGFVDKDIVRRAPRLLPPRLRALTRHAAWRTITLLGSSMPADPHGGSFVSRKLVRWEWQLWRSVRSLLAETMDRCPTYGDYGLLPPDYELPDFARGPQPYVKYTSWRQYLYVRRAAQGAGAKTGAYHQICIELVATPQFQRCGAAYSLGDFAISEIAANARPASGGAGHWIRTMTDHHLVFATRQIAALP